MPGFEKANAAFRDYAAKTLQAPAAKVHAWPDDQPTSDSWEGQGALGKFRLKVGNAWAFEANPDDKSERAVRGWATPDGTVIAHHANLEKLFAEAGVWSGGKPALDAQQLAEHLTWSFGPDHKLTFYVGDQAKPPALDLKPDGSGTLKWVAMYRQPGPGGAGGGPQYLYEYTVTLSKDKKAQIARSRNLNGGHDPSAPGLLPW
jgi:hypothetical protein